MISLDEMEYRSGACNLNLWVIAGFVCRILALVTLSSPLINISMLEPPFFIRYLLHYFPVSALNLCTRLFMFDCLPYHVSGMTSPGIPLNIFHFMVALSIMITIIMLEDKAKAILHQFSHTVITSMELTRLDHGYGILLLYSSICLIFSTCQIDLQRFTLFISQGYRYQKKILRKVCFLSIVIENCNCLLWL